MKNGIVHSLLRNFHSVYNVYMHGYGDAKCSKINGKIYGQISIVQGKLDNLKISGLRYNLPISFKNLVEVLSFTPKFKHMHKVM